MRVDALQLVPVLETLVALDWIAPLRRGAAMAAIRATCCWPIRRTPIEPLLEALPDARGRAARGSVAEGAAALAAAGRRAVDLGNPGQEDSDLDPPQPDVAVHRRVAHEAARAAA